MGNYKKEFLEGIINHYQPMSAEKLTFEDGREIADNLADLGRWMLKAKKLLREKAACALSGVRTAWDYMKSFLKSKAAKILHNRVNRNAINRILKICYVPDTTGMHSEKINLKHYDKIDYRKHSEVAV